MPGEPLGTLLTRVRACQLCAAHLPCGPRPVLQAHAEARILIAGQAPMINETMMPPRMNRTEIALARVIQ